jgi:serine/threonine-protein kinase
MEHADGKKPGGARPASPLPPGRQPETVLPVVTPGSPRRWGRYDITAEIARGAMGAVYRAKDLRRAGQEIALKVLLQGRAEGEDLERFKREARSLARLAHPSIVRVYDFGINEGCPFITMDFVAGTTLESLLTDGDLPLARGLVILEEVARAVDHAHGRGVVHRDLKPANVLIGADGRARITDFGLAKILGENVTLTRAGDMIGTPLYMSPEQVRGELTAIGPSCDVWSLGVTIYLLLTREQPFGGKTVEQVAKRVLEQEPKPPRSIRADVAPDLERICLTALQKDPRKRYQSAGELARDLSNYLHGRPVLAGRVTLAVRARRAWRAAKLKIGLVGALILAIGLGIGVGLLIAWSVRPR